MDAPLQTSEVRRVAVSADIEMPGDYCFIGKRDPKLTHEMKPIDPPTTYWKRLWWTLRGSPIQYKVKETIEVIWPDYDAIVMACPHCNQTIGTTKEHRIISVEPLTIDKPLACAYSRGTEKGALPTIAFNIKDGNIMPA